MNLVLAVQTQEDEENEEEISRIRGFPMDGAIFLWIVPFFRLFFSKEIAFKIAVKLRSKQIVCSLIAIIVASFIAYRIREPLVPFLNNILFSEVSFFTSCLVLHNPFEK